MSAAMLNASTPEELRPLLHDEIDRLPPDQLDAVRRLLLEIEARRLADELGAGLAQDWATGRMSQPAIEQAIADHRSQHPYR